MHFPCSEIRFSGTHERHVVMAYFRIGQRPFRPVHTWDVGQSSRRAVQAFVRQGT